MRQAVGISVAVFSAAFLGQSVERSSADDARPDKLTCRPNF
jgi:hypothetical protein